MDNTGNDLSKRRQYSPPHPPVGQGQICPKKAALVDEIEERLKAKEKLKAQSDARREKIRARLRKEKAARCK